MLKYGKTNTKYMRVFIILVDTRDFTNLISNLYLLFTYNLNFFIFLNLLLTIVVFISTNSR